jgi:cation diffusion facilitator CzcD-associated flavoprotein CzcO
MLQRSPSYVAALPAEDPIARFVRRVLPTRIAYSVVRWKNVLITMVFFQLCRRRPEMMRAFLRKGVERRLPDGYDVDTHFKPTYNPWDQRMCLVPDGDLFEALSSGRASVVTDRIDTFTETGIRLESGAELEADLVVTATGLNMTLLGGVKLAVDGREVEPSKTLSYKGLMLTGVPNMAFSIGYTNASWTLKCDLTCDYVCRLINHMDERGYVRCVAECRDPSVAEEPIIDFSSGYVLRALDQLPKQGSKRPWRLYQNYPLDLRHLRYGPIEDDALEFSAAGTAVGGVDRVAA